MKKIWITASIIAALSVFAAGAVRLVSSTSTPAQAIETTAPLGAKVFVPPQCQASRMQIPTSAGLEWKQFIVCPDVE